MRRTAPPALAAYIATIAAANWATAHYGLIPVAPGLTATAGTYAAGAALGLRDLVHHTGGRTWVIAGITAGAAITTLTSPTLAIASTAAFTVAELADWAVYSPLRARGWARAVLASNTAGAVLDTLLFLTLAGFPVTAAAVSGQLVGKVLWVTLLPILIVLGIRQVRRAVPRHTLGT
jgi:uncharacterized PurR-regulated membrane protein YhhQ (DUF165 family)